MVIGISPLLTEPLLGSRYRSRAWFSADVLNSDGADVNCRPRLRLARTEGLVGRVLCNASKLGACSEGCIADGGAVCSNRCFQREKLLKETNGRQEPTADNLLKVG